MKPHIFDLGGFRPSLAEELVSYGRELQARPNSHDPHHGTAYVVAGMPVYLCVVPHRQPRWLTRSYLVRLGYNWRDFP